MSTETIKKPWLKIVLAVITASSTILVAYFGYLASKGDQDNLKLGKNAGLVVNYTFTEFGNVELIISNNSDDIFIVEDIMLHWDYQACNQYYEPHFGAPLVEYTYKVPITKDCGMKLVDKNKFKYGNGDADKFIIYIKYPGQGMYKIWLEYKYYKTNGSDIQIYKSKIESIRFCDL